MFQTIVRTFLWDLVDEGIDTVLDRLQGEAGATGISVPLVSPSVAMFRPHANVQPRTFRSEGGLQFQPTKDAYIATRIKPITAGWLKKTNPLATIAQACSDRGLTLRAQVNCCQSELFASRYDACAVKDAYGDIDPTWLCPSNPDVREFLAAIVADLSTNYPIESIEISNTGFPPPFAWIGSHDMGFHVGETISWLGSLCFCESCRQSANAEGMDVSSAARSTTVHLDRALASCEPLRQSKADFLENDPILRSFDHWRTSQTHRLFNTLRDSCSCRMVIEPMHNESIPGDYTVILPMSPKDELEPYINDEITKIRKPENVELAVSIAFSVCSQAADLVRTLISAERLGIRSASIDHYTILPLSRLSWIKQAARYALRESE